MNNFHVDVTSDGDLAEAMKIAFHDHKHAEGYLLHPAKGLVFFWYLSAAPDGLVRFPFKMDHVGAADFARRWLGEEDYGREPDHDGDNKKGWRLYNEVWGHVGGWTGAFVAVKPAWAMYGK